VRGCHQGEGVCVVGQLSQLGLKFQQLGYGSSRRLMR
jgi:hypothetical protein